MTWTSVFPAVALVLLALGAGHGPALADDSVLLPESCNLSGARGTPMLQGAFRGLRFRVLDLGAPASRKAPPELNTGDGLRGRRAGEETRLRIDIVDREGKTPTSPMVLFVTVDDAEGPESLAPGGRSAGRRSTLGTLRLPGKTGPCPAVQVLWMPPAAGRPATANGTEVEYTLGTQARLAGLGPADAPSGGTTPLWAAHERIRILAGAPQQGGVTREIETTIDSRVEAGPPVRLLWSSRAPRPAGEVSIAPARSPGPAPSRIVLGDLYELVDRYGNRVWGRFPTSATQPTRGPVVGFARHDPEDRYEYGTYAVTLTYPGVSPPVGTFRSTLRVRPGRSPVESILTLRFEANSSGSLDPADGFEPEDPETARLPFAEEGQPRLACGSEEVPRLVFRLAGMPAAGPVPQFEARLEDRYGNLDEDAEIVAFRCPRRGDCEEELTWSDAGIVHGARPGPDGYLAFAVSRSPGGLGAHFLALRPTAGAVRVGALREPFLSRTWAVTVGGTRLLGPDLDENGTGVVRDLVAWYVVSVDDSAPSPLDLSLSAWDEDGEESGPVERLYAPRVGTGSTFVGRFNVDPGNADDLSRRPTPRRPTVGAPGNVFVLDNRK